jgi:hypothetical protein
MRNELVKIIMITSPSRSHHSLNLWIFRIRLVYLADKKRGDEDRGEDENSPVE